MPQLSVKKLIEGIIQFLIAIPVVLYICVALLTLLILLFVIVPVVIPIATKIWYLDYIRSTLREVSRSLFYVSLVSTAFSVGPLLVCGYLIGRRKVKAQFESALDQDGINLIAGCLFVPYPKKMRIRENYYHTYYKHRGILIPTEREYRWRGLRRPRTVGEQAAAAYRASTRNDIGHLNLLTTFAAVVFSSMVAKDYFVLKATSTDMLLLGNGLGDLVFLWGALVVGVLMGKEIMKSKVCCRWGKNSSGGFSRATIVGDYLCCSSVLASGPYVVIYDLVDVDEVSFQEAEMSKRSIAVCTAIAILSLVVTAYKVRSVYALSTALSGLGTLLKTGRTLALGPGLEVGINKEPERQLWSEAVEGALLKIGHSYADRFSVAGHDVNDREFGVEKQRRRVTALAGIIKDFESQRS
jgi:hypothetical protein